jgi:hypothetical protein
MPSSIGTERLRPYPTEIAPDLHFEAHPLPDLAEDLLKRSVANLGMKHVPPHLDARRLRGGSN